MNVFLTEDKLHYRKWVNVIFNLLLNGSAHYFSGRKKSGIAWFVSILIFQIALVFTVWCPLIKIDIYPRYIDFYVLPIFLVMIIDSFRKPVQRLSGRKWLIFILISIGIGLLEAGSVFAFNFHVLSPIKMPTASMSPTIIGKKEAESKHLKSEDWLLVNRLAYKLHEPKRGDIVLISTKGLKNIGKDVLGIKRLVGMPGETITIHPPFVCINGKRLEEPRIFQKISNSENGYKGYLLVGISDNDRGDLSADGINLLYDEYFVLGDNSAISLDSRTFGSIRRENIIGKVTCIIYPIERKGWIE